MLGLVYIIVLGGIVLAIIQGTPKWRIIIISLLVVSSVIRAKFFSSPVMISHLAVLIILSLCGYITCIWNNIFAPWLKKMKIL